VGVFARGGPGAGLRVEGFLARVVLVRLVEGGEFPSLAADAWVEAVIEAGKRTGFVGDLGRGLTNGGLLAVVGLDFSCGVPPRVDRAVGFVAGLSEARLGLRTGAVVRSWAASRGKGGLLALTAFAVVEGAAGVACLVAVLVLVEPIVDGRFLTVCEGVLSFSVEGADAVVDSFCRIGSSFGLEIASAAGAGSSSLPAPFWAEFSGVCFARSSGDSFWMLSWPPLGVGDATLSRPDTTLSPLPILGPNRSAAPSPRPLAFLKGEAWLD
jgi:hypothetical protein